METVQTVWCEYESPTQAANGAAVVQIGKVNSFIRNGENVISRPRLCCAVSHPVPKKGGQGISFGRESCGGSRKVGIKRKQVGGGSVGGIGVNASRSFCR